MNEISWIVSQIGSRELYAVPRSFHQRGHLARFFTDIWCRHGRGALRRMPLPYSKLARRYHADLPSDKVVAFSADMALRQFVPPKATTVPLQYEQFAQVGARFATHVSKHVGRMSLDPRRHVLFAFSTGALETLRTMKSRGIVCVVDQLDPAHVDEQMVQAEALKWPGWELLTGSIPKAYFARLEEEWRLADVVIVNSNWSKRALTANGVPSEKIVVVPLAYEPEAEPGRERSPRPPSRPLTVLWIGQVILRKGIPYLMEAARRLLGTNVRFLVAGRIGITEHAKKQAPQNMKLLGEVSRAEVLRLYSTADVFVLPTMSDGFALTQLEAMAFGLPVITTSHCGDVVTHERDGLIIPAGDSEELAAAIARLERDRSWLAEMRRSAALTPSRFTLAHYATRVEDAVALRRDRPR